MSIFLRSVATAALVLSASTADAATFLYSAKVESLTQSGTSPGDPVVAPVGTPGTVTLSVDDSDPLAPLFDPGPISAVFTASVSVPGYFSGEAVFVDFLSSFTATADYLQFTTYGDTSYVDTGSFPITVPDGYHSFRVDYGAPLVAAPVTVGDVVAALAAPGASGFFRHEIVLVDEENDRIATVQTTVAFSDEDMPEVPLPAAGWMLLAGLLALPAVARRR